MELTLTLKLYWPRLVDWLRQCYGTGFAHGSALVEAFGAPMGAQPGLSDNVARAERVLALFCDVGWIKRCDKPTPTREQKFFGIGGTPGDRDLSAYPSAYGYESRDNPGARLWLAMQPEPTPPKHRPECRCETCAPDLAHCKPKLDACRGGSACVECSGGRVVRGKFHSANCDCMLCVVRRGDTAEPRTVGDDSEAVGRAMSEMGVNCSAPLGTMGFDR